MKTNSPSDRRWEIVDIQEERTALQILKLYSTGEVTFDPLKARQRVGAICRLPEGARVGYFSLLNGIGLAHVSFLCHRCSLPLLASSLDWSSGGSGSWVDEVGCLWRGRL